MNDRPCVRLSGGPSKNNFVWDSRPRLSFVETAGGGCPTRNSEVVLGRLLASREQLLDHPPLDVSEPEVPALESIRQTLVVQAEEVENRGLEVVDVDAVLDGGEAELVGLAEGEAGFHAAAGEPHGISIDVVVATDHLADLAHRCAAELAAPDHEGGVEEAARLQVADQGGAGAVDLASDRVEIAGEILAGAAVVVPVGVVELDEAGTALDESAGEQAVIRK